MSKIILTDVDNVLLDWQTEFSTWALGRGYKSVNQGVYGIDHMLGIPKEEAYRLCREFNESRFCLFLKAFRDSQKYVDLLHRAHGYQFVCLTSMSNKQIAKTNRTSNLHNQFCESAFKDIICLDTGADKNEALAELKQAYPDSIWIEDKAKNALLGHSLGLQSYLMRHDYNKELWDDERVVSVENWEQLYHKILMKEDCHEDAIPA